MNYALKSINSDGNEHANGTLSRIGMMQVLGKIFGNVNIFHSLKVKFAF